MSHEGIFNIIAANPQIATQFDGDTGPGAVPILNILNIVGNTVANSTIIKPVSTSTSGNTVTVNVQTGAAVTGNPVNVNKAGVVCFDDTAFTVNTATGYVELKGGGGPAIDSVHVDDSNAPGTNPVVPDGAGLITVQGVTISAHNWPVQSFSRAANTWRLEVQLASDAAVSTAIKSGLAHFDRSMFSVDANGYVTLNASAFTTGSVIFWGADSFEEDNPNFFWDNTNNRLGIGTNTPSHSLEVVGTINLVHSGTLDHNHAFELNVNANGIGNIEAIDIGYVTGAISAGEEEAIILINIDETAATGGEIFALEVLSTTEGTDTVGALKAGIGVDAIHQEAGTFGNIDNVLNIVADVTAAVASGGAGNISMFVADNDTITMGDAAKWDETEVMIDTAASGGGIAPVFAFSTGGAGFTNFTPVDGTNGFKNTGVIAWEQSNLVGWAVNASGRFEIRITRTRNVLTTTPIVDTLQLGATTEFVWDAEGNVNLNGLSLVVPLTVPNGGTGLQSITNHGLMVGSGSSQVTPLGVAGNGFLPIGSVGTDPVLGSLLSADGSVVIAPGPGTIDLSTAGGWTGWVEETGATRALLVNQGVVGNRGTTITMTLPATAAQFSTFRFTQKGAGSIKIAQNDGQVLHAGSQATTTGAGGSIESSNQWDAVEVICTTADTTFQIISMIGNFIIV